MKTHKTERLKKLEAELNDLQQWMKLGLVPKKEINKHSQEIRDIEVKIKEEEERINFLKESGDIEEYTAPKKQVTRAGYTDMPTLPDMDMGETGIGGRENHYEMTSEQTEGETTYFEDRDGDDEETATEKEEKTQYEDEDEESYFSDRARWRRGGIQDPDANEW